SRADKKHKGHLTSLYAIWLASGYVAGPLLATGLTRFLSHRDMFLLAAALGIAAALYLGKVLSKAAVSSGDSVLNPESAQAAERQLDPSPSLEADLSAGAILGRIKTSCFAA